MENKIREGRYWCPRCGMAFYTRGGLDQHFKQNPKCRGWAEIQRLMAGIAEIYEEEDCPGGYSVIERHKWELKE